VTQTSPDSAPSLRIVNTPVLVREQAFERLRDAIINGQFPPGARLIERNSARQWA
jgi:DNA-binding GntR family transcriptional regulator